MDEGGNSAAIGAAPVETSRPVVLRASDPLIVDMVANSLIANGRRVEIRETSPTEASGLPESSVTLAIPPQSLSDFHLRDWPSILRSAATETPMVVLADPAIPLHAAMADRSSSFGLALLDRSKNRDISGLCQIIDFVATGLQVVDPCFGESSKLANELLTATERRVLDYVAAGCSNRSIAEQMFLSERTVETHIRQILRRLSISESPSVNRRVLLARSAFQGVGQ